ncbi:DUF4873 domain-containing protein [Amycolatopsis sp. K13G38]|uniref:DUF4873 domain-containing protein n=1 Tax=Amycolatopsis acididurans TaxID=2724524 RepID=A0ABX1JF53_9PSEU|nr:DUF4873 domain-containing protein [Amycolatopsis acididurans]NKQ57489.1 DUF4873 domain-containing protein [Amycolatopsis acididurans]
MPADDEDGYNGPATLVVEGTEFEVEVDLRGHFQPIDGYYRWYGRIAEHAELDKLLEGRKRPAEIRTPQGSAKGELSDRDPWGRYRILGTSTPPFTVPTTLPELTA